MKRINAQLIALLAVLGLKQYQLAKESGVCLAYVNRAIRGKLILKPYQQQAIIDVINKRLGPVGADQR
jgi:hypothetical protein